MNDNQEQGIIRDDAVGYGRPPVAHRFSAGQSGNPAGRPRGRSVTALLREVIEADDGELAERLIRKLIERAMGGDFRAMKEIMDRLDGKPRQSIALGRGDTRSPQERAGELLVSIRRMVGADEPEAIENNGG